MESRSARLPHGILHFACVWFLFFLGKMLIGPSQVVTFSNLSLSPPFLRLPLLLVIPLELVWQQNLETCFTLCPVLK